MTRILTGVVLVAIVFVTVRFAPVWVFWGLLSALALGTLVELTKILERIERKPWPLLSAVGIVAVIACFLYSPPPLLVVMPAVIVALFARAVFSADGVRAAVDRLGGTLLVICYLGLTLGPIGGLRVSGTREYGADLLIFAIVVVYAGDALAYYGGRTFGRTPLAPLISPKKTWEGAVSGLVGSIAAACTAPLWFFQALPWFDALLLAVVLNAAGVVGDLSESLFKRAADVKDSSGLLPGHGGLLDRIDSLLLSAPLLYLYQQIVVGLR